MSNRGEFSESELLLLTNYEYFKCSAYSGMIKDNIASLKQNDGSYDMQKVISQGATGDIISEEDAVDILQRIESDSRISNLHMARCIDKGGIRGTLFLDEKDENAVLVFRGTGGTYKAWKDNVVGEYKADTRLQKMAADFVNYECAGYENITVTGHSKGANLAQYVTVVCGSQIDRCVAYDGQGFSKKFLDEHGNEINMARDKITSINGFNDFVNILLTPIAGEVMYVKNQEDISVDMHSCYTLLSNGDFDVHGDFKRDEGVVPQLPAMTLAKCASDGIVGIMDILPDNGNEKASDVLAAWVASIFSSDKTEQYEEEQIREAVEEFRLYTNRLLNLTDRFDIKEHYLCDYLNIKASRVKDIYIQLDQILDRLRVYPEYVEDILVRIDYNIIGRSLTEHALKKIIAKLDKNIKMLEKFNSTLFSIVEKYESVDTII